MKKTITIVAVLAFVATMFSGCLTATLLMSKGASDEKNEITQGKVFEIEKATVEYANGDVLSFKDYGKFIRVDKSNGDFLIITPTAAYECTKASKSCVMQKNNNGEFYYSDRSYVFPTKWFRLEKFADDIVSDTNHAESIRTVAGKTCTSFRDKEHGYEVAGYNRIYMYKEENGEVLRRALNMNSSCNAVFEVPSDYSQRTGSIEYGEKF